jgi:preprotein translocase subunit SecE
MATKTSPTQFIAQVRAEVAKVVWPTRREVLLTTIMVFIMAALTATFFSLVDMAIRFGLKLIIGGARGCLQVRLSLWSERGPKFVRTGFAIT